MEKSARRASLIKPSAIGRMLELSTGIKDVIHLEHGEPDFVTPSHILEAAEEAMNRGFTHYTEINGMLELREAIAEKLEKENNISADPKTDNYLRNSRSNVYRRVGTFEPWR